jgi:hypothetical protein
MSRLLFTAALSLVAVAAGAVAVIDDEPVEEKHKIRLVWNQDGDKDELNIEELDLEVGESREIETDGGRTATITREENGYSLDIDGKTMHISSEAHSEHGAGERRMIKKIIEIDGDGDSDTEAIFIEGEPHLRRHKMHRIEIGESGEGRHFVIREGGPKVMVLEGEPGEHHMMIRRGRMPGHGHEEMIERIQKSEKFQALDDTTREIVLDVVREAMPKKEKLEWIGGEGEVHDLDVIIEKKRKVKKDDD